MNEISHNFKIEHDTAFKLEKTKVERLINCLNKKMDNENLKNCNEYILLKACNFLPVFSQLLMLYSLLYMPLHRVSFRGGGGGRVTDPVQVSERVGPPLFLGQIPFDVVIGMFESHKYGLIILPPQLDPCLSPLWRLVTHPLRFSLP